MKPPRDDLSQFLAKIGPFVERDGARNLNEISRELSIPYQTLRTRMTHLADDGFSVLPIPDLDRLGLERAKVFLDLTAPAMKDAGTFFRGLDQSGGIRSYARSIYFQTFDCEFIIPRGTLTELEKLLHKLEEMKLVENVEVKKLRWRDVLMPKAQFFDYSKKEWDVDFSRLSGDLSMRIPEKSDPLRFDFYDLLMIKELEMDPWRKTIELARKFHLGASDAAYHLNQHVFGKKLIKTFRLRWNRKNQGWLKHAVVQQSYIFNQVSEEDAGHAMSIFTSLPFTWCHMMTEDGTYVAEVMLPTHQYAETTQYLSKKLLGVRLRPSQVLEQDWSCSSTFTIPYKLYDKESSKWNFEAEKAAERVVQMVKARQT